MGQHYVSEEAFRRKAAERGFGAVSPDAYPAFCAFVYAVTRAALALVSLVTPSHVKTIQPEDFMTLEKIGSLLVTPVLCGRGKNQRGGGADEVMMGGAPVNTSSYFGGNEPTGAYGMGPSGHSGDASGLLARQASVSTFQSPLLMAGGGAAKKKSSPIGLLAGDAIVRLLQDYKRRTGSDVLVSETAKRRLRTLVETNVDGALRKLRSGKRTPSPGGKPGKPSLTASGIKRAAEKWVLQLKC